MMRVRFSCFTLLYLSVAVAWAQRFPLVTPTDKACILYDTESSPVDSVAAVLFAQDIYRVSGYSPTVITKPSQISGNVIVIGTVTSRYVKELLRDTLPLEKTLNGKWETYAYRVVNNAFATGSRAFVIAGSDPRGTAYGVLDLSQKIGVSPWYWWADVPVQKKSELSLEQSSFASSPPSVKYRGIFLNDEDWGLLPWASKTFDPQKKNIGPKTYERIFELLLRLKGNIIWPAMHPGSEPFFYDPGNIQMAEAYGIVIGTSHAEPMLRNNVGEWDKTSRGDFNYLTNRSGVLKYWDERVSQTTSINAIYTLGMRGVHDSKMEGVKDLKEAVPYLEKIISEQRDLLEKYRKRPAAEIPQVFTAYKEVLEIYDYGLKLPDDVTLVWPDDNYGYIQRLNTPKEAARTGGSGVYYHASYWGRPHDYLWLGTTHPALMRSELMKAYESGATTLWVLNVGDIKPLEYQVQLFMDMANNARPFKDSRQVKQHLDKWAVGIFGDHAGSIADVLMQSYDLAFSRRPEFMGWSQTEPTTKTRYTAFNHFYFGDEGQRRIDEYNSLQRSVREIRNDIPQVFQDAFYELVYYPVVGASLINKKFLYRDKAFLYSKQNRFISTYYAESSNQAFDSIALETDYFNEVVAGGKWRNMMSMKPRNLPVFHAPDIKRQAIADTKKWDVVPEGYDTTAYMNNLPRTLKFTQAKDDKYFVDVFLTDSVFVDWSAEAPPWITLSSRNGTLNPRREESSTRIWVTADWRKIPRYVVGGKLTFLAGGQTRMVNIEIERRSKESLKYKGFVERNGVVSMSANHYSRLNQGKDQRWIQIDEFGLLGPRMMSVLDSGSANDVKSADASMTYQFFSESQSNAKIRIFSLPTHPLNKSLSCRYGIKVDEHPMEIVDIKTVGRSEEWKENVLRNEAVREISLPVLARGEHTLTLYAIDPGIVLDRILILFGTTPLPYSVVPETR